MLSSLRGSSRNPIQILDEDQQVKKNEEMIEFQRNRQAIYRAHMGSNFDVLVAIIKLQIKGSDEEKDQVLRNRIRKFFSAQSKTIDVENEHFRKKREPDYSDARVDPVPNQLVLFGVDFISTKQIKQKFTGLNPDVQWLDDSNCKVKFNTHELAKRGIEMNLKNKSQSIVKLENDEMQLPKGWFELQSYYYLTFERKLWCRYAASNENELQIKRSNDYYMYQRAKQQFEESLKQQITEDKYYEIMTKYRFTDQHKIRERQEKNNRHQVGNGYRSNRYGRDDRNQRDGGRDQFRDRDDRNRRNWNNDNRNRDYNYRRNDDRQREQEQFKRSREKNNGSNQKDFDNISIISKGKSISSNRIRKPRKQSLSICSNDLNNSPSRENQSQENYSFILGQEQLSNSQQFAYQMKNLSIQSGNNDFERKNKQSQFKEQELSFSFFSNGEDNFKRKPEKNQSQNANLSFQFEPNRDMSKKKPDTSFNLGTSFSSVVKQKKIQQIQLYDNDQDK